MIMPVQDDSGKVVGTVLYEDAASGNYSPCFVTICFSSQMMKIYPAEAEVSHCVRELKGEERERVGLLVVPRHM